MTPPFVLNLQQSSIAPRSAVTWCFERDTVLVVQHGRVWATLDNAALHDGEPRSGDWFLDPGMTLRVAAGERIVLESVGPSGMPALLGLYAEVVFVARRRPWTAGWLYAWRSKSAASAMNLGRASSPSSGRSCSLAGSPSAPA